MDFELGDIESRYQFDLWDPEWIRKYNLMIKDNYVKEKKIRARRKPKDVFEDRPVHSS